MSSTPFVSVIMPTYNRAGLIGKALESVLAQSFQNWELLIIDDGSTDNTKEVIAKYTDHRIRYIYQNNAERCAARNNGIRQSLGKYITFLDSDDYYLPNRLQLLYAELESRGFPEGFFYTGLQLQDIDTGKKENKDVSLTINNRYDRVALGMIHSQQVVATKNVFEGNLYNTTLTVGEDMELWLRIAATYDIEPIAGQCTIVVVEHGDRSINVKKANPAIKQLQTYDVMFGAGHPGNKISTAVRQTLLTNAYLSYAKYHIYKHERTSAAYWLLKSITTMPGHPQTKYKLNLIRTVLLNPAQAEKLLQG